MSTTSVNHFPFNPILPPNPCVPPPPDLHSTQGHSYSTPSPLVKPSSPAPPLIVVVATQHRHRHHGSHFVHGIGSADRGFLAHPLQRPPWIHGELLPYLVYHINRVSISHRQAAAAAAAVTRRPVHRVQPASWNNPPILEINIIYMVSCYLCFARGGHCHSKQQDRRVPCLPNSHLLLEQCHSGNFGRGVAFRLCFEIFTLKEELKSISYVVHDFRISLLAQPDATHICDVLVYKYPNKTHVIVMDSLYCCMIQSDAWPSRHALLRVLCRIMLIQPIYINVNGCWISIIRGVDELWY